MKCSGRRALLAALILGLGGGELQAQDIVPISLSLEEAIEIALDNNPNYQATRNDESLADWDVRSAYASWAPSASASGSLAWQASGNQGLLFGGLTAQQLGVSTQPPIWSSSYGLNLTYSINGNTILAPGQAKANRNATRALVQNAEADLIFRVTQQYIDVLRQQEQLKVSEQQLARAEFNHELAVAQVEVGTATAIDAAQAEVAMSRAEITRLQGRAAQQTAMIRLMQLLGVEVHRPAVLTTPFRLEQPRWEEDALFQQGLEGNPNLRSIQASHRASEFGVRMAKSTYLPSLSLSAGIRGFTREASSTEFDILRAESRAQSSVQSCLFTNDLYSRLADPLPSQDCTQFQFTDEQAQAIRSANDVFPFDFTTQPASASMNISFPIFQGFNRQRQVEAAQVQLEDLDYSLRQAELALRADIAVGIATVETAYEAAVLEQRNQQVVDQQLRLATERFTVGLADFVELLGAETLKVEADRTLVAAIFAYHDAIAQLEATVGTSLRD
jgi:outer membrane protein